jgi:hypothetical protein
MKTRALFCFTIASCVGTDTGNPPVIDFRNSGCNGSADKGVTLQSLDYATPDDLGLSCLRWEHRDDETVRIVLTNYHAPCGADSGWQPRVKLREDGVDLILEDRQCALSSCDDSCVYDLTFVVGEASRLPDGLVRLYQQGCDQNNLEQAEVPLASLRSGIACRYADYQHVSFFPTGNQGDACGSHTPTCQDGLRCTNVSPLSPEHPDADERCLPTCTSNADCDAALSECTAGACQLKATGLSAH